MVFDEIFEIDFFTTEYYDYVAREFALNKHEVGKAINKTLENLKERGYDINKIEIFVNGEEHTQPDFMLDVKRVAKHMKTEHIENKIMGDLYI